MNVRPGAVGRDHDFLVVSGAAEVERVEAAAAVDGVTAVARIPDEHVVAGAEGRDVAALTAHDAVVARGRR